MYIVGKINKNKKIRISTNGAGKKAQILKTFTALVDLNLVPSTLVRMLQEDLAPSSGFSGYYTYMHTEYIVFKSPYLGLGPLGGDKYCSISSG